MTDSDYRIMAVEDEEHMITTFRVLLGEQYSFTAARSIGEARHVLEDDRPDLLMLDLGLPDGTGVELLRELREDGSPDLDVIVITATRDVGTAVQVMKLGAVDYIQKPFEREDLLLCVQQACERWKLRSENELLRNRLDDLTHDFQFGSIIAASPQMLEVIAAARKMARSEATLLITGESGTGKELIAQAVHYEGIRSTRPFVALNCAQFTGTLLESELFGHERGAFTGAAEQRKGRFELADSGTLFLDEVGTTPLEMQAKILRVVETQEFERVGGQNSIRVDVRLIAATNADLRKEIERGNFREDLYYRLNVVPIEVPPLRERKQDIPHLCDHFLSLHMAKTGRRFRGITPEAMAALMAYDWRGNVRELHNVLERTFVLEESDWVTTRYFPEHMLAMATAAEGEPPESKSVLEQVLQNFERRFLTEQLRVSGWNHRRAARSLGVHRNTIENKIRKYGIHAEKPVLR